MQEDLFPHSSPFLSVSMLTRSITHEPFLLDELPYPGVPEFFFSALRLSETAGRAFLVFLFFFLEILLFFRQGVFVGFSF